MFSFEISQIALTSQGVRFALRWHDVDFENNRIFISSAYVRGQLKDIKTKSEKREVTLQPQSREALLSQQASPENRTKPFSTIRTPINRSAKKFGFRH